MAERAQIHVGKIATKLLLQLAYVSILLLLVPIAVINEETGFHYALLTADTFNSSSWFIGYYFAVILIAAIGLNRTLNRWERKEYLTFILALFAVVSFSWTREMLCSLSDGLEKLVMGVCLYALGGYIKKYNPFGSLRLWVPMATIVAAYALMMIAQWNYTTSRIEDYLLIQPEEAYTQSFVGYELYSALIIVIAVAAFELFRRLPSFRVGVINYLSGASLMVYLLHDNEFFYQLWNRTQWIRLLSDWPVEFVVRLLGWVLVVYALGTIAYTLYMGIQFLIHKSRILFVKDN